jgi:hypothetical protein
VADDPARRHIICNKLECVFRSSTPGWLIKHDGCVGQCCDREAIPICNDLIITVRRLAARSLCQKSVTLQDEIGLFGVDGRFLRAVENLCAAKVCAAVEIPSSKGIGGRA